MVLRRLAFMYHFCCSQWQRTNRHVLAVAHHYFELAICGKHQSLILSSPRLLSADPPTAVPLGCPVNH